MNNHPMRKISSVWLSLSGLAICVVGAYHNDLLVCMSGFSIICFGMYLLAE